MTVYVLMQTSDASHHYPRIITIFKGVYESKEKAWEAIEREYQPLLKIIEEYKYTIRGIYIDSSSLTVEYENFVEDFYCCETYDILETEVKQRKVKTWKKQTLGSERRRIL